MEARLTEFSYGYCVTEELANGASPRLIAAPYFPSLSIEGKKGGGFDVKIGSALFLQFKLCEEMTRRSAEEAKLGLLMPRFYRFWLQRRDRSAQHQMLMELESDPSNQVYYIAPKFADVNALDKAYRQRRVVERSALFSPIEIGPLADDRYHRVAFRADSDDGWFLSQPKRVPVHHKSELFRRAREIKTRDFRHVNEWLGALATRMRTIREKYAKSTGEERANIRRAQRSPLEQVAYQARTHFGCELFVLAEPTSE